MSSLLQERRQSAASRFLSWLDSKLSRVTSSREFIPEIDGLRFVAIFFVVLFHAAVHIREFQNRSPLIQKWVPGQSPILGIIGNLFLGVQIFFVISGFVIALPFVRSAIRGAPKPALSRYFMRRLTRIEPPYILALLAMYLILDQFRLYLPHLLAGLFYLHRFIYGDPNPINIVTWTLEIEVLFYILAPWITLIYRIPRQTMRWSCQLALICVDSYFVHEWFMPRSPGSGYSFTAAFPFFLAGIFLADLYVSGRLSRPSSRSSRLIWDAAALLGLVALIYCHFVGPAWRIAWLSPIMVMTTVVGGIKGLIVNQFLRFRPVTVIGGMCYSIYLWHIPILGWLSWYGAMLPRNLSDLRLITLYCLVEVPLILLLSMPIYYFIERPFMNGPGSRFIERVLRNLHRRLQPTMAGWPGFAKPKTRDGV